mgnify:CR=1 FL=1|tara:strand:+ start:11636 stop:12757 length:1122 start_codon:yes stop_codon:yes gene_type:complete
METDSFAGRMATAANDHDDVTPPPRPSEGGARDVRVLFSGRNLEYQKLWLVNMLLTLLTLGIYSAWAKVRNHRYLYGHTSLDGHRFSYLAKPLQILRGRLIALLVLVLLSGVAYVSPIAASLMYFLLMFAVPWLICQGIRFTLRMTSYRQVRFDFTGDYGGIMAHFIFLPLIAMFTFYFALPWVLKKIDQYTHNNITYGGKAFNVSNRTSAYYHAALVCVGLGILSMVLLLPLFSLLSGTGEGEGDAPPRFWLPVLLFVAMFVISQLVAAIWSAMIRNHLLANLSLDGIATFRSDVTSIGYAGLAMSNALLLIVTLGLAYPVTQVRMLRYLAEHTEVTIQPAMDSMINTVTSQDGAFGEEAAGLFDVDVSVLG